MTKKQELPWIKCSYDPNMSLSESQINTVEFLEYIGGDTYEPGYFIPEQEALELWEMKKLDSGEE